MPRVRFDLLFILLVLIVHIAVFTAPVNALLDRWFTTDDAFYYFQVARNISEGYGSTFDRIHPANGYHPLWMLLMIPVFSLARLDEFFPLRVVVLISVMLSAGSGLLLYRLLARLIARPLAILAAFFWVFFAPLHGVATKLGMEAGINAFTVILFLYQAARLLDKPEDQETGHDRFRLGFFAVLALFSRLDNAFLVLSVGLVILFRRQRLYLFWLAYLLAGLVSGLLAFFIRLGFPSNYPEFLPGIYLFLAIGLPLKIIFAYLSGMFIRPEHVVLRKEVLAVFTAIGGAALIGGAVLLGLQSAGMLGNFPRLVILIDAVLGVVLFSLARWIGLRGTEFQVIRALTPLAEFRQNLPVWLRRGIQYSTPIVFFLGGYLAINQSLFGTPTPVSGQVKHWWGTLPDIVYGKPVASFPALFGFFERLEQGPWWLFFSPATSLANAFASLTNDPDFYFRWLWLFCLLWGGLVLGGLILRKQNIGAAIHQSMAIPLLSACLIQILYYTGSYYVNLRSWYWMNESLLAVIVTSLALDGVYKRVAIFPFAGKLLYPASILASAALTVAMGSALLRSYQLEAANMQDAYYLQEARLLAANTPTGSVIGMPGGGATAYFLTERTIVNLDGLINSYAYFRSLKQGNGRDYLDRLGLDYVFGNEVMVTAAAPYYTLLQDRLQPVTGILEFILYRYTIP